MATENKCYSCGKSFKNERDLQRHKNRKTPCLIRELTDDIKNNPNRCIYCNKIFANKSNLNKHHAICKVKNGGMEVLADKVQRDQEMEALRNELREELRREFLDEMRNMLQDLQPGIVNNTFNAPITVNINFNNFRDPKIDTLQITQDDITAEDITSTTMRLVYFNEKIPENHVIFQPNIREQRLLIRDQDSWKNVKGDDLDVILSAIKQVVYNACHNKINELCPTDDAYNNLHPVVQQAIYAFNSAIHERTPNSKIMNNITSWRQIPKVTLVNEGIVSRR